MRSPEKNIDSLIDEIPFFRAATVRERGERVKRHQTDLSGNGTSIC
jgi:hypothetical protein